MNILITGASGFIGSALKQALDLNPSYQVKASTTRLSPLSDWTCELSGIDVVIHTAAQQPQSVSRELEVDDPLRNINVYGSLQLAEQAAKAGVKRFIFISSAKVNGDISPSGRPFTVSDIPHPYDAYGQSKHAVELVLRTVAQHHGLELVIIRPPLVYGPGVRGNFRTLMEWVTKGIPLPLGAIHNKRSFVALPNLVDLITHCLGHESAAGHTFFVSDDEDVSTSELVQHLAELMHTRPKLWHIPPKLLSVGATLVGKPAAARRLCGSLQVDIRHTKQLLGWHPPVNLRDGLRETVQAFNTLSA